ncbi:DNA cytosine methyltransferase [Chloroflexus islandicus]|uniref:DNA cytosine methyltransferase n=1 Tax=Chloroflexus islandicus TaxID=1707952 RepID=UPI0009760FA5|nr:DNA cytosine methyltransferase [Chloroflexus islandicus]
MSGFTFVDLFCGAGGFSLGFIETGFTCVLAADHDQYAVRTYQLNLGNHVHCFNITNQTDLPYADVVIGGPPCQGFSSAGLRRLHDQRNSLIRVFANLVANIKPKAFVFENVEGFLTIDNGSLLLDLLDPLIEAGYRVHVRKVNAANYGVPQNRKRIIVIGGFGWDPTFPLPTHQAFGAPGAANACRHLPLCPTLADALADLPPPALIPPGEPQGYVVRELSPLDQQRITLLQPGQSMKDLPVSLWHESYRRRAFRRVRDGMPSERRGGAPFGLRRLRLDQPASTITSGALTEFVHPVEHRFLTLRECARIQSFPDHFVFVGSNHSCILQIANAVPSLLSKIVASTLWQDLQAGRHLQTISSGALLSFVPTVASGMSPVLQRVDMLVRNRYLQSHRVQEQLSLWP